jgi:hypothetical protein
MLNSTKILQDMTTYDAFFFMPFGIPHPGTVYPFKPKRKR